MRYLVTGAAGFIGSAITKKLLDMSATVISVDNLNDYYSTDLKHKRLEALGIRAKSEFFEMDICDRDSLNKLIKDYKPDQIIHLAAQAGVRLPMNQNRKYVLNNILGFENVLSISVENNIKSLIYASSSSVYGERASLPYVEDEQNLYPTSFYGYTKLINEKMVKYYTANSNIKFRGIRFFTVYGPWGRPDMAYFRICASLLGKEPFRLFGDGKIKRDFTFIDDAIESLTKLSEDLIYRTNGFKDVVNIGGGKPTSINEMIETAERISGIKEAVYHEKPNILDVSETKASTEYLYSLISYVPNTTLSVGLEKVMSWMKSNTSETERNYWIKSCP